MPLFLCALCGDSSTALRICASANKLFTDLNFYLVHSSLACNAASDTHHGNDGHPVCMSFKGEGADIDFRQIQISLSYTHARNKRITYDEQRARYVNGGRTERRGNRVFGRAQPYSVRVLYIVYMCARAHGVSVQRQQLLLYIMHAGWTHCVCAREDVRVGWHGDWVTRLVDEGMPGRGTPGRLSPAAADDDNQRRRVSRTIYIYTHTYTFIYDGVTSPPHTCDTLYRRRTPSPKKRPGDLRVYRVRPWQ